MATERMDATPKKDEEKQGLSFGVSLLLMAAIVVVAYYGLRTFVVGTYEIPSASMQDTIQIGDRIFSEKITYYGSDPKPGDIITFTDPRDESRTLIKRVIAVGGQTVDLRAGAVYVDGTKLDEPYTEGKPSYPLNTAYGVKITYPYTVPSGCLWVMGDNRTDSADSRYFGVVDKRLVTGHAALRFWPANRIGTLD